MLRIKWNGSSGVLEGEVVKSRTEHLVKLPDGKYVLVDERCVIEKSETNNNEQ